MATEAPGHHQTLDRNKFNSSVDVVVLIIPVSKTNVFMKQLKAFLFNRPKMRSVVLPEAYPSLFAKLKENETLFRGIILSEEIGKLAVEDDNLLAGLPTEEREWVLSEGATPVRHIVELGYDLLTVEQVLRQVLPSNIPEIPSSFETAGHIAHLNLREEVLPYKYIVAQVILDKNVRLKTVVNKTASIASEFRTFPLEVLAGDDDLVVELKEGGASFKFDFGSVYWNSRLQFEHSRLSDSIAATSSIPSTSTGASFKNKRAAAVEDGSETLMQNEFAHKKAAKRSKRQSDSKQTPEFHSNPDKLSLSKSENSSSASSSNTSSNRLKEGGNNGVIVADLMGGVGPFAVPLAQRGCQVHANDLNPESYKWLVHNVSLNRIQDRVHCNNGDAREFVARLRGRNFKKDSQDEREGKFAAESDASVLSSAKTNRPSPVWFQHAIMNLPQTAIEFLDAFQGYLYTGENCEKQELDEEAIGGDGEVSSSSTQDVGFAKKKVLPVIHVYCFEKETDGTSESAALAAIARCNDVLEFQMERKDVDVHVVRYVSPQKPMLCLSFRLPLEVASRPPKYT